MLHILYRATAITALYILLVFAFPSRACSQGQSGFRLFLSLEDALHRAETSSYLIRHADATMQTAVADLHGARAAYFPRISLSTTAATTTDPLESFGYKLKQAKISSADFDPVLLNDPERMDHFSTRFEVIQPIFNPAGILRGRAARSRVKAAEAGQQLSLHSVVYQVKQVYHSLLLAREQLVVLDSSLAVAKYNRAQTADFLEEGLILNADLLEADVHVLTVRRSRTAAASQVETASDQLRLLLDIKDTVEIVPTDSLTLLDASIDLLQIQGLAQERSRLKVLRYQVEAAGHLVRASQAAFFPKVSAFGGYEWNDSNIFGTSGTNWGGGVSLRWNLFAGFENIGSIEKARAELRSRQLALEEQVHKTQIELRETLRFLAESQQQVELAATSVAHSRENLHIRSDRYAEGVEKTSDVLNAEVNYAKQRLVYLESIYQYNSAIFRLEFLLEKPLVTTHSID